MSASRRIRVLVVDDSAFARKVLREVLSREPRIEVVDVARDGLEAMEKIAALRPDVVTLDLVMPNLDGVGVLTALPREGRPRILVVSFSDAETELGAHALQLGALDIIKKPTALATERMYELSDELVGKVLALAGAQPHAPELRHAEGVAVAPLHAEVGLVAVGTSTGGPQALTQVIAALPPNLPVPVVVALHIPPGFTDALARRLDDACPIRVVEAHDGMPLLPGSVTIARGGIHLKVERHGTALIARLDVAPLASFTPSVDVLFESAAEASVRPVLGVVLTGMGDDGLAGARRIRARGGRLLVEAPETCVIYGMPRVVQEAGLARAQVPLHGMARAIVENL